MAKTKAKTSGSAAIRDVLAKGITKPAEIVEAVKAQHGISVKTGLVNNVKAMLKKKGGAPKGNRGRKTKTTGGHSIGNGLVAAIEFVKVSGGLEAAKKSLAELEAIKAIL